MDEIDEGFAPSTCEKCGGRGWYLQNAPGTGDDFEHYCECDAGRALLDAARALR